MKAGLKVLLFALALPIAFVFGFGWKDISAGEWDFTDSLRDWVSGNHREMPTPTEIFTEHLANIRDQYRSELDRMDLRNAAMAGLFTSLGDPHTQFLNPQMAASFADETRGELVGVGARLSPDPFGALVVEVFRDGPAERNGLQPNDTITAVDGENVSGDDITSIVDRIRGEPGTSVRLRVLREESDEPLELTIERGRVQVPTATFRPVSGTDFAMISISGFAESTPFQFDQALEEALRTNPRGLIIDVRTNPGGLLESAVAMLSRFVSNRPVVSMQMRGERRQTVSTPTTRELASNLPVVVLINEQSASASEIFAGVLRDYNRATLVGETTYGKASVQTVLPLVDAASAKITIARYYLPNGEDISRRVDPDGVYLSGGVAPDVEVTSNFGDNLLSGDPEQDAQLAEAVRLLESRVVTLR